jgi:hypothetical protein
MVVVLFAGLALPAVAGTGTFVDDDDSVHEADIEALAAAGITRGCNPPANDRFCPEDPVTRGQMAAFLVRALGLAPAADPDPFSDDDGSVFADDVARLAAARITRGCNPPSNDRFCPEDPVTRGQMAAFLVRAYGYPASADDAFDDDDQSVFEADIDALAAAGITRGCADTSFCPEDPVTRAQMASFLVRAEGLEPISPVPTDPTWYATPTPVGLGARTVTVPAAGSPTLEEALDDARPGDVIELGDGTHVNTGGNLVLSTPGTADAWIAIRAAAGADPVIDLQGAGELRISASYVLVEGVEIVDGGGNNLHIAPETESISNVVVRGVEIHDLRTGPGAAIKINRNNPAGVSSVYIEDSDLSESIDNAVVDGVGVNRAVVRTSDIHDNEVGSHGVFFKGGSSEILIEANLIRGIRQNAALQLGGNTGAGLFDPAHAEWEGVDQVARNNLIADFDDSAVEIRGVDGGRVYHNTIVTQSGFAVFRLQCGNTNDGGSVGNRGIEIAGNLVVGTGGNPQYARNDCGDTDVSFGANGWIGGFVDSGGPTPGIPDFPLAGDVVVDGTGGVLVDADWSGLNGWADAVSRYTPVAGSVALGAGSEALSPIDLLGEPRSSTTPTLGAIEGAVPG